MVDFWWTIENLIEAPRVPLCLQVHVRVARGLAPTDHDYTPLVHFTQSA